MEMHLVIKNFNETPRMRKLGVSISLRIGVHVDEVLAGNFTQIIKNFTLKNKP